MDYRDILKALEEEFGKLGFSGGRRTRPAPRRSRKPQAATEAAARLAAVPARQARQPAGVITEGAGVMTEVGEENARRYSAILAGRQAAEKAIEATVLDYPNITPPGGPAAQPAATAASQTATQPAYLESLSDRELRALVNQLHGVKAGETGSVGRRVGRAGLLHMATEALGPAGAQAKLMGFSNIIPPPAPAPAAQSRGYQEILPPPPRPQTEAPAAAAIGPAGPQSWVPAPPPAPPKAVAEDIRGLTWAERHQRLVETGKMLPEADVAARLLSKQPTQRQMVVESEREEHRARQRQYQEQRTRWETANAQRQQEAARAAQAGPAGTAPGVLPPAAGTQPEARQTAQNDLLAAIKRLTEAMQKATERQPSVAEEVAGMSWGERMARLQQTGGLLPEQTVQAATLKERVTTRDIILESERQEQRKRDAERQGRGQDVARAGGGVARAFGGSIGDVVSRLVGPTIGASVAQAAERVAQPVVSSIVSRLAARAGITVAAGGAGAAGGGGAVAAGAAGAAGGGGIMGGIVGRLAGGAAAHPVAALATAAIAVSVAFWKLPGAVERIVGSALEAQRALGQYSAAHQALFARLDYQKRLLDLQTAKATAGSVTALGRQYELLRDELQPLREMLGTIKNTLLMGLTFGARVANAFTKMKPEIWALRWAAERLEKLLGKQADPAIFDYFKTLGDYGVAKPKNRKPGEGGR